MRQRRRNSKRIAGALVAVAVLLIAGCGSSSKSSSGTTATTASGSSATTASSSSATTAQGASSTAGCSKTSNVKGITGTQITVAGLINSADFGTDLGAAAKARFQEANNDNELPCGRKINVSEVSDDGGSPTTNLSDAQQMVQQAHVFAIVPAMSPFFESTGTYLNEQKVPAVGWGVSPSFCTTNPSSQYMFAFNGCLTPQNPTYAVNITGPSLAKAFELAGKGAPQGKTFAIIGDDDTSSKSGNTVVAASIESAGFKQVYNQNAFPPPPAAVTDFSPYVQAIMTANGGKPPDALYIASGPANAFGLCTALQQAGYKGVCEHSTYAPQVVAAAKGDQVVNTFATTESNTPAMQHIVATLHAGGVTAIGQPELAAYFSADMFIQILKAVGPDLTPQRFQQVASTFTYSIPGVVGPSYYPAGFQTGAPCGEMVYSDGTKWTISAPYACYGTALKKEGSVYKTVPYPSGVTS